MNADKDALICDLAETYGIYDYESLPIQTVATLAVGLRGDSRIKMKMRNEVLTREELFLAMAVDYLALLAWTKTKEAKHGRNKPESIVAMYNDMGKPKEIVSFDTAAEFEAERQRILNEVAHG